jgi:TPR repeat protein
MTSTMMNHSNRKLITDKGDEESQIGFGEALCDGKGVQTGRIEAVKYFKLAAEKSNWIAECCLGLLYLESRELPDNDMKWREYPQKSRINDVHKRYTG